MRKGLKSVRNILRGTRTFRRAARFTTRTRGRGRGSATRTVNRRAVSCPDTKVSLMHRVSRILRAGCHANISSTQIDILLPGTCPLTGRIVPPLEKIEEGIDRGLRLWSWPWNRSIAVKGIALVLRKWALTDGLEIAAKRGAILLEQPDPLRWGGPAPLFGLPPAEILTVEGFAEMLGGLTDELEGIKRMRTNDTDDGGDKLLLQSSGTAHEGDRTGSEPNNGGEVAEDSGGGVGGATQRGTVLEFPKIGGRRRSHEGLSRGEIVLELRECRKDLSAFQSSYSAVHYRVQEVKDEGRMLKLVGWSGTGAVMGTLDLAIHAIERTIDEMRDILRRIDNGEICNIDEVHHGYYTE